MSAGARHAAGQANLVSGGYDTLAGGARFDPGASGAVGFSPHPPPRPRPERHRPVESPPVALRAPSVLPTGRETR
jgi:hypothetical protein